MVSKAMGGSMKKMLIVLLIVALLGIGFGIGRVVASSNVNGNYESRIAKLECQMKGLKQALPLQIISNVPSCEPYPWNQ